jgi:hypothetical protein
MNHQNASIEKFLPAFGRNFILKSGLCFGFILHGVIVGRNVQSRSIITPTAVSCWLIVSILPNNFPLGSMTKMPLGPVVKDFRSVNFHAIEAPISPWLLKY